MQEWAWNVYPSTNISSAVVVLAIALSVFGYWVGTEEETLVEAVEPEKKKQ